MTLTIEVTVEQLADAIRRLPFDERIAVLRLVSRQLTTDKVISADEIAEISNQKLDYITARAELDRELAKAAEALLPDYENDEELTAFTSK